MILEGWPEGAEPPARPTKKWEPATGRPGRGVKIILGELGFSSDLSTGKTIARKQQKYAALIRELEAEGWRVDDHIRVITVGVRATVPLSNDDELKALGIADRRGRQALQHTFARIAGIHLGRIIRQYRRLCRRRSQHGESDGPVGRTWGTQATGRGSSAPTRGGVLKPQLNCGPNSGGQRITGCTHRGDAETHGRRINVQYKTGVG